MAEEMTTTSTTTSTPDFQSTLGEYKGDPAVSSFKDAPSLAKGYKELVGKLGSRNMADFDAPKDDTGKRAVYAKLGREIPGTPDGYGLKYPDGMNGKPEKLKWLSETAGKLGLSKSEASGLLNELLNQERTAVEGFTRTRDGEKTAATEQLKKDWGAEYDKNQGRVNKALDQVKTEAAKKELQDAVARHPELAKLFEGMGHAMEEGTYKPGTTGAPGATTVAELQAERGKMEKQMTDMQAQKGFDATSLAWRTLLQQRQDLLTKEGKAHIAATSAA